MTIRPSDLPRSLAQKILTSRLEPVDAGGPARIRVEQVALARLERPLLTSLTAGTHPLAVETTVVYDSDCTLTAELTPRLSAVDRQALANSGCIIGRPGLGFAGPVHLERFASPGRIVLTDDARLAMLGGLGCLALPLGAAELALALTSGSLDAPQLAVFQLQLTGRFAPFVGARDLALELERIGLAERVAKLKAESGHPVVLEFGGTATRGLSVDERALVASAAPSLGALTALFPSDEKSEVFLRDQRRSKAFRALSVDPGAPCGAYHSLELSSLEPLIREPGGRVRFARELSVPVSQVIVGGDSGGSLRALLTAATLLKSKRLSGQLDLLLCPASRQVLEVLAREGALGDLVAAGARVIEPDRRLLEGSLHVTTPQQTSLRTFVTGGAGQAQPAYLASMETAAYCIASGHLGDPRALRRPARITLPRALPTDDTLLARQPRSTTAASA